MGSVVGGGLGRSGVGGGRDPEILRDATGILFVSGWLGVVHLGRVRDRKEVAKNKYICVEDSGIRSGAQYVSSFVPLAFFFIPFVPCLA